MPNLLKPPKLSVPEILKIFTTVPKKFIDDFFSLYSDDQLLKSEYVIDIEKLAKWLDIRKDTLLNTLRESYQEGIDYTKEKRSRPKTSPHKYANNQKKVMITPECMKRLCMRSNSAKSESVRTYFIEIEQFLFQYNKQIVEGIFHDMQDLTIKNRLKSSNDGPGYMYIIRASEVIDGLHKLGQTRQSVLERLRAYNVGRAKEVEPLYTYYIPYRLEVERCVKRLLKGKRYIRGREIYEIDNEIIAKLIQGCGQMSMKLHYAARKSTLTGKYFVIFDSDIPHKFTQK